MPPTSSGLVSAPEVHFFVTRRPGLRILGSEDSFTDRCAWDCVDALDDLARRQFGAIHSRVNHGIEKSLNVIRFNSFKCFFNFYETLVNHIHGGLKILPLHLLPEH